MGSGRRWSGGVGGLVLGAATAAPAMAKSSKIRVMARPAPSFLPPPAYGFRKDGRAHSSNPAYDVYVSGRYSGSDPDSRIRADLARDPPWGAMESR